MIVPSQVLQDTNPGVAPDPLQAAGVTHAHALMAAAEMKQSGRLDQLLQQPQESDFKKNIEMQRTLDQLGGPRQAPAPAPKTKSGKIASKGGKHYG